MKEKNISCSTYIDCRYLNIPPTFNLQKRAARIIHWKSVWIMEKMMEGGKIKICYVGSAKSIHMQRWRKGLNVGVFDEMLDKEEIENLGLTYMNPYDADIVFDIFDLKIIKRW